MSRNVAIETRRTLSDAAASVCSAPAAGWWLVESAPVGASGVLIAVVSVVGFGHLNLIVGPRTGGRGGDIATSR